MTQACFATPVRRKLAFLAGFVLYFAVLWLVWETPFVYPLKIFVVMLHEISHGIAAIATGGTIDRIVLDPAQGGACYCPGGNAFLTLSAGYLGSLLWGILLLGLASRTRPSPTAVLTASGAIVAILTLLYVRSAFGLLFGIAFGTVLVLFGRKLGEHLSRMALRVLGLTSCLYAILDIKSDVLDRPHLRSDAAMLAEITTLSTTAWGFVWTAVALLVCAVAFARAYRSA